MGGDNPEFNGAGPGGRMARWPGADPGERAYLGRRVLASSGVAIAALGLMGAGLATAKPADQEIPADVAAAIGIDDGGPTETVVDGLTGFLCRPDPESFAEVRCDDLQLLGKHVESYFTVWLN